MTFQPPNTESSYLPATFNFNKDPDNFLRDFNILYRKIAQSIADRESGRYDCIDQGTPTPPGFERVSGQQWSGSMNGVTKGGYRKVVNFPALIVGVNSQPHNLGTITTFTFTRIDGVMQSGATSTFAPVPNGAPHDAYIEVNGANVNITLPGGSQFVGYTAVVVLEYLKN